MDERERRVVANEVVSRTVNEELAPLQVEDVLALLCECGRPNCHATISVSRNEYEQVRSQPTRFLVKSGHEIPEVETTVSASGAHVVIEKDAVLARQLAQQHNPRT